MTRDICIYHGHCADGFGAAWAVWKRFGDRIDYHPGVYGQAPPDVRRTRVIMVDFSYKRAVLEEMAGVAEAILILDHHKTAQEDLAGFPAPPDALTWLRETYPGGGITGICALFDMERSGAGLAWDYFHAGKPRPKLLDRIEDRDLWRFKLSGSAPLHQLVRSFPDEFHAYNDLMERAEANLDPLIAEGQAIERKHHKDIAELLGLATRRMVIGGVSVPVANLPYTMASDAGNALAEGEPFAACYFDRADKRVFSLRSKSDGIDVSAIAKLYGGGGHKNAAGFEQPIGWEGDAAAGELHKLALEGAEESNLVTFARKELQRAGLFSKDSDYGGMLGDAVLKMIASFSAEGHSGWSAGMAVSAFERLARFEPLTPLTGSDDEWVEVGTGVWQNSRCSRVFKEADGVAYDIQAVVFEEPNGARFSNRDSRRPVEFPYTPKTEIVKRPAGAEA